VNFLRTDPHFWDCFQYEHTRNGKLCYVELRKIFEYERDSKNKLTNTSKPALLAEIGGEEFRLVRREDKLLLNVFEQYLNENSQASFDEKRQFFEANVVQPPCCERMHKLFDELYAFLHIEPKLPCEGKTFVSTVPIAVSEQMSREEIIAEIEQKSAENEVAELALFAARRMDLMDWTPFVKAVVERNPVCVEALKNLSIQEIYDTLQNLKEESIYNEPNRLALPDEVWNYQVGDGLEKAFAMASIVANQTPKPSIKLTCSEHVVTLNIDEKTFTFRTEKTLTIQNLSL